MFVCDVECVCDATDMFVCDIESMCDATDMFVSQKGMCKWCGCVHI